METNIPSDQEFPLSYNAYAAFDAQSLKLLMQQRLSQNGVFTDQVFEGSNFNNLLDVVAYSYNVLLYYLNQTSNESLFSNVQLYENMNKIVKFLNYSPVGVQTSILNFEAIANDQLPIGVYTIPKFSYFTINDIYYSFNSDLTFVKSSSGSEILSELSDFSLLYQGQFIEYPILVSTGESYEEVNIVSVDVDGNNDPIDHNNIFVFIREDTGVWNEWKRVDNLYLENGSSPSYEARLNENQRYSIKFGNNVTGKKLNAGNLIAIYFLKSDKGLGSVGANTLNENNLFFFSTDQYNTIMNDVRSKSTKTITLQEASNISFTNSNASTNSSDVETVDQIRKNAPNTFKTQGRLVTVDDFTSYIKSNFSNVILDAVVVNNWEYLDEHIRYLYNMGLKSPMLDSRVLLNQVTFADSCNFNNTYIYCIPKVLSTNDFNYSKGYLSLGLKDYILTKLDKYKLSNIELVFQDPVFYAVGFGTASQEEIFNKTLYPDIAKETKLIINKSSNNNISVQEIKKRVKEVVLDYFSFSNSKLGKTIDLTILTQQIYNISGIESIFTQRNGVTTPGLSIIGYNPVYSGYNEDISIISQSIKLPFFKAPFWFDTSMIDNQIVVLPSNLQSASVREY